MYSKQKSIGVQEIISSLNNDAPSRNSSFLDSLRFSEDYEVAQPRKTEEYEQITLQFDDDDSNNWGVNSSHSNTSKTNNSSTLTNGQPQKRKDSKNRFQKYKKKQILEEQPRNSHIYQDYFDQVFNVKQKEEENKQKIKSAEQLPKVEIKRIEPPTFINPPPFVNQPPLVTSTVQPPNKILEIRQKYSLRDVQQNRNGSIEKKQFSEIVPSTFQMKKTQSIVNNRVVMQSPGFILQNSSQKIINQAPTLDKRVSFTFAPNSNPNIIQRKPTQQIITSGTAPVIPQSYQYSQYSQQRMQNSAPIVHQAQILPNVNIIRSQQPRVIVQSQIPIDQVIQQAQRGRSREKETLKTPQYEKHKLSYLSERDQQRLPIFMRKLRRLQNTCPNLNYSKNLTKEAFQALNKEIYPIVEETINVIKILSNTYTKFKENEKKTQQLIKLLIENINKNSQHSEFLVTHFTQSKWQILQQGEEFDLIQPRQQYQKRQFKQIQFHQALKNYLQVLGCYNENTKLLINNDNSSIGAYLRARGKLWSIERNLRMISQDLYQFGLTFSSFPKHFYEILKYLKRIRTQKNILNEPTTNADLQLMNNISELQKRKDVLACSCLGNLIVQSILNRQRVSGMSNI